MRHVPKHSVTDEAVVRRLVEEHPWTTFISNPSTGLNASHYPAASRRNVVDQLRGVGLFASPALADDMERALAEGLGGDLRPRA